MAQKKLFDGVIEAVRYAPDGQVAMVRMYERRATEYSDRVLVTRDELTKRMKAGQRMATGQRTLYMGSSFDVTEEIRLVKEGGKEFLTTTASSGNHDNLKNIPVF